MDENFWKNSIENTPNQRHNNKKKRCYPEQYTAITDKIAVFIPDIMIIQDKKFIVFKNVTLLF